jgi:hypothetical protein
VRTFATLAMVTMLAGCKVAATAEEYVWTIKAPTQVQLDSKLMFVVETHASAGRPVMDVPFVWKIEWAGLDGIRHQGRSFREEWIRVKGDPGTAVVRIFAVGLDDQLIEVTRASVRVVGPTPPAD